MGDCIGTKFAPPYSILFMGGLEEEIIKKNLGPKKIALFPEIGWGKIFSSLTRPHSRMCIRIYIFCFKQKNTHTETKTKRN